MSENEVIARIREKPLHIGDDENSSWSVNAIGTEWVREFFIADLPRDPLYFQAGVWATASRHNEVEINGHRIGHLPKNNGDTYMTARLRIPEGTLHRGGEPNELRLLAGRLDEHGSNKDDYLIRKIRVVTGGTDHDHGGGGRNKRRFFSGLSRLIKSDPWEPLRIRGFQSAGIFKNPTISFSVVCGFFDGDAQTTPETAHLTLAHYLSGHEKLPQSCVAVAVFEEAPKSQIQLLTTEARSGAGGGGFFGGSWDNEQSLTSVIDLGRWDFHPPVRFGNDYYYNKDITKWMQKALDQIYEETS